MTRSSLAIIAAATAALHTSNAFVLPSSSSSCVTHSSPSTFCTTLNNNNMKNNDNKLTLSVSTTALQMSSTTESATNNILKLTLEKPLGLILEEADDTNSESSSGGVIITQVNEGGSAHSSPSASQLLNAKITKVMSTDVSNLSFDDVMDVIIGAPSPLEMEFMLADGMVVAATEDGSVEGEEEAEAAVEEYEIGTTVTLQVEQPDNKPSITLEAKVGDNLRKTLLSNKDIELYRGLKKKLGNCGGGGQCGFCAVELVDESEGGVWGKRSEYEDTRIGTKAGTEGWRLACMNNVVGPATVKTL